MGVSNYSSEPNANTSISGINIAEGCPPSGINNAIRQLMADIKVADGGYVKRTGSQVISGGKTFANIVAAPAIKVTGTQADNGGSVNFYYGGGGTLTNRIIEQSSGTLGVAGGMVISGTLDLPKNTDASGTADNGPALRVGPSAGAHLEIDGNEIMAKNGASSTNSLYLNGDGGAVIVGSGGLQIRGSGVSLSIDGHAEATALNAGYTVTNSTLYCTLLRGTTYCGLWDDAAHQWIVRVNDTNGTTDSYYHYGTVKTISDEREKKDITTVSDALLDAWNDVQWQQFRYVKNDARVSVGIIAQRTESVLRGHGIDAEGYGVISHEQDDGNDRYYVQYTEALAVEAAYQRRRADRAEARMAALERRLDELEAVLVTLGE